MKITLKELVKKVFKEDMMDFVYDTYGALHAAFPEETQVGFVVENLEGMILAHYHRMLQADTPDDVFSSNETIKQQLDYLEKTVKSSMNENSANMVCVIIGLVKQAYVKPFE